MLLGMEFNTIGLWNFDCPPRISSALVFCWHSNTVLARKKRWAFADGGKGGSECLFDLEISFFIIPINTVRMFLLECEESKVYDKKKHRF